MINSFVYQGETEIDQENEQLNQLYTALKIAQIEDDSKLIGNTTSKIIAIKRNQEKNIIKHYYKEVEKCITYKLEKKISINTLIKVENFFKDTKSPITTANKILSKRKNNLNKTYQRED